MTQQIKLYGKSKGETSQVDDDRYLDVRCHQWWIRGKGYVCTTIHGKVIKMQDFIMGPAPVGFIWDHIDRDRKNNQRDNLRLATRSQNAQNSKLRSDTVSGYKGVSPLKSGKFLARITVGGKTKRIGIFGSALDAAIQYDAAALRYFGEFASTNFEHHTVPMRKEDL